MNYSPPPPLPNPPGPWMQKINLLLHETDGGRWKKSWIGVGSDGPIVSYVFYMCYWCTILGILAPVIVWIYLPLQCALRIVRYSMMSTTSYFRINSKNDYNTNFTYDLLYQANASSSSSSSSSSSPSVEIGIVITGCDTGFGKELALFCANELGYTVFAGCLHPQISWPQHQPSNNKAACQSFTQHGAVVPIAMDVTDAKQVSNVVRSVQQWISDVGPAAINTAKNLEHTTATNVLQPQRRRILHALINNAGVGRGSLIDWNDDDLSDYHCCMDGT
jgi:hypothetical protein